MDYADYVRGIAFRLLSPDRPRPEGFGALARLARRSGLDLEMWMTLLPEGQEAMQRRLGRARRLKGRSTFAVGAIINRGVAELPSDQAYLAIGLGRGYPLLAAMAGNSDTTCIGIEETFRTAAIRARFLECFERRHSPQHRFHEGSFRDYIEGDHEGTIGFCHCAALRTYDDQRDALRLAEPFFANDARILVSESNRIAIRRGLDAFLSASATEYRVLLDVRTPRAGHPTFGNGIVLLQRGAEGLAAQETERQAA